MSGYLIYHPRRQTSTFGSFVVHHDRIGNNSQDPYIWNTQFLHSYCHITQLSAAVDDINFWVSGDTFPYFTHLYCDLVFIVAEKVYWPQANLIFREDVVVDSEETYQDHYRWAMYAHQLKQRRRYTLKADQERSFQPQDLEHELFDVVPFLADMGVSLEELRRGLRAGWQSKPYRIDVVAQPLYDWLHDAASVRLTGAMLSAIRATDTRFHQAKSDDIG